MLVDAEEARITDGLAYTATTKTATRELVAFSATFLEFSNIYDGYSLPYSRVSVVQ